MSEVGGMTHEVYITVHAYGAFDRKEFGPVLRCAACKDWEVDVDGASVSEAARRTLQHEAELPEGAQQ